MSDTLLNKIKLLSKDKEDGNGGWITTMLIVVLSLIAIAIFAFKAWRAGKKRAKLLHKRDVKEEKAHQQRVKGTLDKKQKTIDASAVKINKLQQDITELTKEARELRVEKERNLEKIKQIKSWRDVDENVK